MLLLGSAGVLWQHSLITNLTLVCACWLASFDCEIDCFLLIIYFGWMSTQETIVVTARLSRLARARITHNHSDCFLQPGWIIVCAWLEWKVFGV
jgi:hypothetical protein